MKYSYTLYHQEGLIERFPLMKKAMDLSQKQKLVGGYIEIIPIPYYAHLNWSDCVVYVDEEGKMKHKRRNPFFRDLQNGNDIVGDALKEEIVEDDE